MILLFLSLHFLLKKVQTLQSGFQGSHLIPPYLCSLILLLFLFFTPVRLTHESQGFILPRVCMQLSSLLEGSLPSLFTSLLLKAYLVFYSRHYNSCWCLCWSLTASAIGTIHVGIWLIFWYLNFMCVRFMFARKLTILSEQEVLQLENLPYCLL